MTRANYETRSDPFSVVTSIENSDPWLSTRESDEWDQCINTVANLNCDLSLSNDKPNAKAIILTLQFLRDTRRIGHAPPLVIDQEPTGGIIVTFENENKSDEWTFYNSGEIEFTKYVDNKVVQLQRVRRPKAVLPVATLNFLGRWDSSELTSSPVAKPPPVTKPRKSKCQAMSSERHLIKSW